MTTNATLLINNEVEHRTIIALSNLPDVGELSDSTIEPITTQHVSDTISQFTQHPVFTKRFGNEYFAVIHPADLGTVFNTFNGNLIGNNVISVRVIGDILNYEEDNVDNIINQAQNQETHDEGYSSDSDANENDIGDEGYSSESNESENDVGDQSESNESNESNDTGDQSENNNNFENIVSDGYASDDHNTMDELRSSTKYDRVIANILIPLCVYVVFIGIVSYYII